MKKIFTLILVIIFLFNTAGTEIIFSILLEKCREEAEELISGRKEIEREVLLIINPDNQRLLHRYENREIEYDGMMYDVRKEEKTGNTILIYAYMDNKEESLKNNFASENSDSNNPAKNGKAKINTKNPVSFCLSHITCENIPVKSSLLKSKLNRIKYLQPDIELATPPPQA